MFHQFRRVIELKCWIKIKKKKLACDWERLIRWKKRFPLYHLCGIADVRITDRGRRWSRGQRSPERPFERVERHRLNPTKAADAKRKPEPSKPRRNEVNGNEWNEWNGFQWIGSSLNGWKCGRWTESNCFVKCLAITGTSTGRRHWPPDGSRVTAGSRWGSTRGSTIKPRGFIVGF